ncbi:MAG: UpxY family transcription antiterminator [Lepagella sp.]
MDTLRASDQECVTTANVTDGREARSKFWIAAYTRPKSEKKAGNELANQGIETYVPIQIQTRQWSDRKKKVEAVVIPMILFAHITQEELLTVQRHHLILKMLSMPGKKEPAHIPDAQIAQLKFMLSESETPVTFVETNFNVSDTVRVIRGSLKGLEGKVYKIAGDKVQLIVSIGILGGAKVEIDSLNLEICKN